MAINTRIDVLAHMWPYTSREQLANAVWWHTNGNADKALERASMFVDHGLEQEELWNFLSDRDRSEYAHHAITGD